MSIALRTMVSTAAAATLGFAACSTPTKVTDAWRDPTFSGPMKNLVIVGAKMSDTNRRTLEDNFTSALSARGIRATQSYRLLPAAVPSVEEARAALKMGGFDGALVATPRGVKEEVKVIPGGGFYDYWGPTWSGPSDYVQTDEFVRFETTLWDPRDGGKMVWSALTQTVNPSSGKNFVLSLVNKVVPNLVQAGLISPATAPGEPVSYAPTTTTN
jgi:hypothetical protein